MNDIGLFSYASAALAFLILSILLVVSWQGQRQGAFLVAAVVATFLWATVASVFTALGSPGSALLQVFAVIKSGAWYVFLFGLLAAHQDRNFQPLIRAVAIFLLLLLGMHLYVMLGGNLPVLLQAWQLPVLGNVLMAVLGLILVEQLFRNTPSERRWGIKYLCFGIGGMFVYDFYLYADALLFRQLTPWAWNARGLVYTLLVPLIAVAAARNPNWTLDIFVSRKFVFHGAALLSAGIYLLVMAAGGYYIRYYGGDWGGVAQIVFIFGALIVLLAIMFSGHVRAYLRVFLNKHFFNYKYDYREEWLGFIRKLSHPTRPGQWRERAVQALADIVDSPAGVLWERSRPGQYEITAHWAMSESGLEPITERDSMVRFLEEKRWVINLQEYAHLPSHYPGLDLPRWLLEKEDAWLIVPLILEESLLGLILLAKPLAPRDYNWEDNDILKTAGTQVAGYLAQQNAMQELISARQFEAASRLTAFMMHDLKNMIAQLALLVSNAEKHKHNPEFIDDMVATVRNTVEKMEKMLKKLNAGHDRRSHAEPVDIRTLIQGTVALMSKGRPVPVLQAHGNEPLIVRADADRLSMVIAHVIRNAQDATPEDGSVLVRLLPEGDHVVVGIEDTGCGMDPQFVRERLFRPFDSTKGSSGMGIGAYECREYIREIGGEVEIDSTPGKGTRFHIKIPLLQQQAERVTRLQI